jgi:hypothetical protein
VAGSDRFVLESQCQHPVVESLKFLTDALDEIDTILPNVPPEESSYLDREDRSINTLKKTDQPAAQARFSGLVRRRLYWAWKARRELADAMISVDYITGAHRKHDPPGSGLVLPPYMGYWRKGPDTLATMINAIQYMNFAAGNLREFLMSEDYRQDKLLTAQETQRIWMDLFSLDDDLRVAMQCQLAHIVLDKREDQQR